MEQELRDELLRSRESLFHDPDKIAGRVELRFFEMKTAYVLGWTPEQGEDIFWILINANRRWQAWTRTGDGVVSRRD